MEWFSSGGSCNFYFRMRLRGTPARTNGIDNNIYLVALGRGTTPVAWTGVNGGGNNSTTEVYVTDGAGTKTYSRIIAAGAASAGSGTDSIKVISAGTSEYWLEWTIPYTALPVGTTTTPVGFFGGTSQSNSLSTINRDCINSISVCGSPNFTTTQAVDLTIATDSAVRPTISSPLSPIKGSTAGGDSVTITGTNLANTSQVYFGGKPATVVSSTNTTVNVSVTTPASGAGPVDVYVVTAGGESNKLVSAYTYVAAPTVTTTGVTGLASTAATLTGTVNANGDTTSAISFCWGTSSSLTSCSSVTSSPSSASGVAATSVSYLLTGLALTTTYYFKLTATNPEGTTVSTPIASFRTAAATLVISNTSPITAGQVGVPYSFALQATGGTGTYTSWANSSGTLPAGLTLNTSTGVISGTPTTVATSTPSFTVTDTAPVTSAAKQLSISIAAGLPSVTTSDATNLASTSATLNGSVAAKGAVAQIYFCLSSSGAVSSGALTCDSTPTSSPTVTSSSSSTNAATSNLTSLISGKLYFYQIYATATGVAGTAYGAVFSFIPAAAPTVTTNAATAITISSATLSTTVAANGSSTSINFCVSTSATVNGSGALTTCSFTPAATDLSTLNSLTTTTSSTGLSPSTTYYYQGWASNTTGTTYGNVANFTTSASPPTITSLSIVSGPVAGGTSLTITGTNFTGTSSVTFGGSAATSVLVISATSVSLTNPSGTVGLQDVVLTTPGGSVTSTGAFTYIGAARNPTFGTPTKTAGGFTVSITNYDSGYTWPTPTVSAGSISVSAPSGSTQLLTVTGLTSGQSAEITATTTKTNYYGGSATVSSAAKTTPTFSWSDSSKNYGDADYSVTAPTPSVPGTFTYTSATTSVATITSSGTVHIAGAGTTIITATFTPTDATNYTSGLTTTMTLTVGKANQAVITAVTLSSSSKTYPYSQSPLTVSSVVGGSGTGALSITSVANSSATGCNWDGTTLTASTSGTCTLTITKAADSNYNAQTATTNFTFNRASPTLTFSKSPTTPTYTNAVTLTVTGLASDATGTVTFQDSSSITLCTVTLVSGAGNCSWTPAAAATYAVTASYGGDTSYTSTSSSPTNIVVGPLQLATPTTPTVIAVSGSTTSATVTFPDVAYKSSYQLQIYLSDGVTSFATFANFTSGTVVGGLTAGTLYKIGVLAVGTGNYSNSDLSALRSVTTNSVAVAPVVSTPADAGKTHGQSATFSVSASTSDAGVLTHQWQYSTDSGATWQNVASGSGASSTTFTTDSLTTASSGYKYRSVVVNTLNGTTATTNSVAATLTVASALSITTPVSGLSGQINSAFSLTILASGGAGSNVFTIVSGSLPSELTLSSGGVISGTPTTAASYPLTVRVTDANGATATTTSFTVQVAGVYSVTYNLNGGTGTLPTQSSTVTGGTFTLHDGSGITKGTQHFSGWSDGTNTYVGASTYTMPAQNVTMTLQWVANSLDGVTGTLNKIATLTASDTIASSYTATSGVGTNSRVALTLPAGSLPEGTVLDIYLYDDSYTRAKRVISADKGFMVSLVVAWLAPDGTIPNTAAGKQITMTIGNSGIKIGDVVYGILGGAYRILGTATENNTITFEVTEDPEIVMAHSAQSPTISGQPTDQSISVGSSANFAITASVTDGGTLSYQWQKSVDSGLNWSNISGATSATYATGVQSDTTASGNLYKVVVTNNNGGSLGYSTSNTAALTVLLAATAPTISSQPVNATKSPGQTATYSVIASASGTLSYQWKVSTDSGGTYSVISGATSASYSTATVSSTDHGKLYEVAVTSTLNGTTATTTSSAASLTVTASAPTISSQPVNQSVSTASTASFSVTATSADSGGILSYTWQISSDGITWSTVTGGSGATTSSYTTAARALSDSGKVYRVIVTNSVNGSSSTLNSSTATLTVSARSQNSLVISLDISSKSTVFTQAINLSASGGSGDGAVIYSLVGGTATGCLLVNATATNSISATTSGTCLIRATKEADSNYLFVNSNTLTFTFTDALPPAITFTAGATQSIALGVAITSTATSNSGGAITSWSVTTLPAGLSMNAATGVISGTPTGVQTSTSYTLTASGPGGTSGATFTLAVVDMSAKTVTFNASDGSGRTATQSSLVTATLTDTPFIYSGHVFVHWTTESDGSGTVYENGDSYNFSVNMALYAQWSVAPPVITFTVGATQSITVGAAITSTVTANSGGAIASWSVTTLPAGLSMDAATGVISGTPTAAQALTTYTLMATGTLGATSSAIFTLTVTAVYVYVAPTIYTITYISGAHGSVAGSLSQLISAGGNGTAVAASADVGYEFSSWSDGSTASTRSESSVFATRTLTATFIYVGPRPQTITFADPGTQAWSTSNLQLVPAATSGLVVTLLSTSTTICTVNGFAVTLITTGLCSLTASQVGGTVGSIIYLAATPITRTFVISKASGRTITILSTSYSASGYASWSLTGPTIASRASAGDSDTKVYSVTSESEGCSISISGAVTFNGAGTCRVQVSISGVLFNDATSPVVSFNVGKKSQDLVFGTSTLVFNETLQLKAAASPGTGAITYSLPPNSLCSISGDKVTANSGTGTCEVSITKTADKDYLAATSSMTITLSKTSQTLTLAHIQLSFGQHLRVAAVSSTGTSGVNYSLSETTACSITVNLLKVLSGTGTCVLTASKPGTTNFLPATTSTPVVLTKAPQIIRFTAPREMKTNQSAQKLSGRSSSDLPVSFQTTTVKVCTVIEQTVKAISAGTCTVMATQSGDLNYAAAEGVSVSFTVSSATKSAASTAAAITWNPPAYMVLGGPLTQAQLNAQANVAGSFVYTPALGTKLPMGTIKLTTVFTPTDPSYSKTIEKSVSITVVAPITPSATAINTEGVIPGISRISGVPSTATVEVLGYSTVLDSAVVGGPVLTVIASPTFSGTTTVNLSIKYYTQNVLLSVPVTVSPARAKGPIATPQSLTVTIFSWGTTESATGYEVKVRGATVCATTTSSCSAQVPVGPATPITITTLGLGKASVTVPVALHIDGPVSGLVVNFDTNSYVLSADQMKQIRAIALIIAREGYTHLIVHGHTDIRGGVDNNALSNNRAQVTLDYIQSLMPGVSFELAGYAASQPVASSESEAGLAANRRAEISVLP